MPVPVVEVIDPEITRLDDLAFSESQSLVRVDLAKCKYLGFGAFQCSRLLEEVSLPSCLEVSDSAFSGCTSLEEITLPNCISVRAASFKNCYRLRKLNLPMCIYFGIHPLPSFLDGTMFNCYSLKEIELPICISIGHEAFWNSGLRVITLPLVQSIAPDAFHGCDDLEYLYVCEECPDIEALKNSPDFPKGATIVPINPRIALNSRAQEINEKLDEIQRGLNKTNPLKLKVVTPTIQA